LCSRFFLSPLMWCLLKSFYGINEYAILSWYWSLYFHLFPFQIAFWLLAFIEFKITISTKYRLKISLTHMHIQKHTHGCTHPHSYVHPHIHTHTHTHSYTHIHTHTHSYTHNHCTWTHTKRKQVFDYHTNTVMSTRPVPIPYFTTDTDIRYLLSISDTGFLKHWYLIHSRYFIIVADIHYFQFYTF